MKQIVIFIAAVSTGIAIKCGIRIAIVCALELFVVMYLCIKWPSKDEEE